MMKPKRKRNNKTSRRRLEQKNKKKYKKIIRLVLLTIVLLIAIMFILLAKKSFGTAIGYVFYSSMSILGLVGIIGLAFFIKTNSMKSNVMLILLVLLGGSYFIKSWNMTMDIPKYVLFNEYKTKTIKIERIEYQKGSINIFSETETYEFVFNYFEVPNNEILEIDYLNKSKIALDVREIAK